ncbi:DUF7338 family protein [Campylobacter concisus]|uniref:Uncharacterized protein n=1 Tax=Campylobacter concisus TaxID=199 RepID=A0A1Y5ND26_9BACT|nr:hypothetical protein [Campylobacter concisus]OUT18439.1 hypothetical protein B9N61_05745 [Campylobacter concisus]
MRKPTAKQICQVITNIIIELPFEILAFFIVPIAVAFCKKEDEHLPKWASWFDDPDYGINGDEGWKSEHFQGKERTYYARLRWLLRNRIGVFSIKFLGVKVKDIVPSSVITQGNPKVTSNGGIVSDWCLVICKLKNGKERFGYYQTIRYKGIFKNFYCRIYLGWKLMDVAEMNEMNANKYLEADDKPILKSVWAINPFKRVNQKGE